ncbi:MAG: hypothetical protein MJZ43_04230 [Bacteroidaceae bacterium]|nr:hypothetical protein [Bacteroidaceae bacterium]
MKKRNLLLLLLTTLSMSINAQAPASSTGTAKRTGDIDVNWMQLWENGPKFAEYNVGVTDGKAESYGGYYCWGGSIDKDPNGEYNVGSETLTGDDDTATKLWGSAWRMPTQEEFYNLLANCDVEWLTVNGVNGTKFTGKGDYASNSVFLPAAGICNYSEVILPGENGCYGSSTSGDSGYTSGLSFKSDNQWVYFGERYYGSSVRAVLAEADSDEEEDVTGIANLTGSSQQSAGYDLQGRILNKLQRGLNIMNGKRVLR